MGADSSDQLDNLTAGNFFRVVYNFWIYREASESIALIPSLIQIPDTGNFSNPPGGLRYRGETSIRFKFTVISIGHFNGDAAFLLKRFGYARIFFRLISEFRRAVGQFPACLGNRPHVFHEHLHD